MATEVIFLRVDPAVKAAIEAQVEGLNKDRAWGQPPHSVNSFVVACINQVLAPEATEPKTQRKTRARRKSQAKRAAERAA